MFLTYTDRDTTLASLLKADADAYYSFELGKKEMAFKVLQERVYPAKQWLREHNCAWPTLLTGRKGGAR